MKWLYLAFVGQISFSHREFFVQASDVLVDRP
jgi:hypothetical protein